MSNESQRRAAKVALGVVSFAIRHAAASVATIAAACLAWTVTYVLLLLWAIVANGGLGGPLAYPAGLVFVAAVAAIACLLLFFPATALAESICRNRSFPILAQIPLSVVLLAVLCVLAGMTVRASAPAIPFRLSVHAFIGWLFVLSLFPIGFYWWVAQAAPLLHRAITFLRRPRRRYAHSG